DRRDRLRPTHALPTGRGARNRLRRDVQRHHWLARGHGREGDLCAVVGSVTRPPSGSQLPWSSWSWLQCCSPEACLFSSCHRPVRTKRPVRARRRALSAVAVGLASASRRMRHRSRPKTSTFVPTEQGCRRAAAWLLGAKPSTTSGVPPATV